MTRGLRLPARGAAAPWRLAVALALVAALLLAALPAPAGAATLTVTTGADSGAGSLRQVIAAAAAGDTITFAPGVTTVTLTSGELAINKNLTIQGSGVGGVRVERSTAVGTPDFRIFHITAGTVAISGLTIANGRTPNSGGGVGISAWRRDADRQHRQRQHRRRRRRRHLRRGRPAAPALTNSTVSGNTAARRRRRSSTPAPRR